MAIKKFESPREEALEIASQTRKDILQGKRDADSIVRACLVIADILNKEGDKQWLVAELSGYKSNLPTYRVVECRNQDSWGNLIKFAPLQVPYDVHYLSGSLRQKHDLLIQIGKDEKGEFAAVLSTLQISALLDAVVDRCILFLNNIISELQYGGIVEYLMEEIRKNTDEKLAKLDPKLTDEAKSLVQNLTSTNPADWNKVGHSCRKILSLLADRVFPPSDELYKMKDERILKIGAPEFINRICAFLDKEMSGDERKFVMAEIGYLEAYLRQVVEYDQMGEHKPSIEKFHADMMAIHTYLVASEILKHVTVP
jgi:hypothetical protein